MDILCALCQLRDETRPSPTPAPGLENEFAESAPEGIEG